MLGFLIPFSGVGNATAVIALLALVMDLILGFVEKRMEYGVKKDGLYTEDMFSKMRYEKRENSQRRESLKVVGVYGFNNTYGLNFKKTMDMDIGLKYKAINQKKIDVMVIFTTDGQLTASDVTVLKDDKQFYPSYLCGNVIRNEVLKKHPELKKVFKKLEGTIIDHLNLSIQEGEFVTMIGSSGCGKTTTLKMVNGLITPDQGDILVHGENIKTKEAVSKRLVDKERRICHLPEEKLKDCEYSEVALCEI